MASVWRHPRSKFWTACFRDHNGRQRRISTKETNRKRALKLAEQYEKATRIKRTLRQAQKVLDQLYEEYSGEPVPRTTFTKYSEDWLATKKPETAASTLAFYRTSITKFATFLEGRVESPLSEITKQDIVRFRNQVASKIAARTANHHLKAIKMLFRSARRDGFLAEDPAEFVDSIKADRTKIKFTKRPFTLSEIQDVLDVADPEWRSLVLFGLYTGQRLADLSTLKWKQIDLRRNEIRIQTRKTGKELLLPIASPLRRHLGTLGSRHVAFEPVHPRACAIVERQAKSGLLSNQFADLLAAAGLREKKSHHTKGKGRDSHRVVEPLSFHSLRRTATTFLHEAGIPAAVAQALIGHDSEAMHQLYIRVGRPALENAVAALPDVEK